MKKCKHCSETITGKSHYCAVKNEMFDSIMINLLYSDNYSVTDTSSFTGNSDSSPDFGGGEFGGGGGGDCY